MRASIVLPTIREEHATAFLAAWEYQFKDHRVIVVEDHPTKTFTLPDWVEHYSHEDIEKALGEDAWIISRKSSAVRNFGTLKALEQPTDFIWHLDDDCLPNDDGVPESGTELEHHHQNLYISRAEPRWVSTDVEGRHVRGMPYQETATWPNVVVSHGTWLKNADYDAPHQLTDPYDFKPDAFVVPPGYYFSMCGMNLAFKPEIAAAMYFAPSGAGQPYDRFDDIWMGIIAKKVLDRLGLSCYTGHPQIVHDRASNPFKNLIKEAPGIEANEGFWQYIDAIDVRTDSVSQLTKQIALYMKHHPYRDEEYFKNYGESLNCWVDRIAGLRVVI